jgi:hypothetical protein
MRGEAALMKSLCVGGGLLLLFALRAVPAAPAVPPEGEKNIAVLSKVVPEVTRLEAGRDWANARRGDLLSSGDRIKTGDRALAIIKFKDNSLVRVRERSELVVTGATAGSSFSKSVDVENGVVGFTISKQKADEEFRFTSPTSVASIRGTGGLFASADTTDTLTVIEGSVRLLNRISSQTVEVGAGFTGISFRNGSVAARPSTRNEKRAAQDALKTGDTQKQLKLRLRDNKGNTKDLIIDFKE